MSRFPALRSIRKLSGFTVVELLVAVAISILLLAGVMTLFANSRTGYERNDRLAQIQENGRFALEMIARDVRAAGYWGCAKRTAAKPLKNTLAGSSGLLWNYAIPIEGFDATSTAWSPSISSVAPLNTDGAVIGNDILVVRGPQWNRIPQRLQASMTTGTSTISVYQNSSYPTMSAGDIAIAASCDQASVFKVTSVTPGSSGSPDVIAHTSPGTPAAGDNSSADIGNRFYADIAEVFPVQTTVYFVKASTTGNSLFRRIGTNAPEEIIPGVDSFQLQYGVDTNADRLADDYLSAGSVTNWDQVVSVRVGLLVRSLDSYGPDIDAQTRTLLDASIPAFNDRMQRQMFTTTATVRNRVF